MLKRLAGKQLVASLDKQGLYPGQVKEEIRHSMRSIFIFSLQGIFIQQGIQHGWLRLSFDTNWYCIPQSLLLFFWNEVHFYFVHRLLHTSWFKKNIHWVHHHSKEPTVFSTFSFHWVEAFLLGTVIVFPMLFYPFQLAALLSLPVMSILLNMLGHCNYEFFPGSGLHTFFKFSNRHSLHHKKGKGNYGFMLPWFDRFFKTSIKKTNAIDQPKYN